MSWTLSWEEAAEAKSQEADSLAAQLVAQVAELERAPRVEAVLKAKSDSLKGKQAELSEERSSLQAAVAQQKEMAATVDRGMKEVAGLWEKLNARQQHHKQELASSRQALAGARDEVASLEQARKAELSRTADLEAAVAATQAQLERMRGELARRSAAVAGTNAEIETLRGSTEALSVQANTVAQKLSALREGVEEEANRVASAESDAADAHAELLAMNAEVSAEVTRTQALLAEAEDMVMQSLNDDEARGSAEQARNVALQSELQSALMAAEKSDSAVLALQKRVIVLQAQIEAVSVDGLEAGAGGRDLAEAERQADSISAQLDAMRERVRALDSADARRDAQLADARKAEHSGTSASSFEAQVAALEVENAELLASTRQKSQLLKQAREFLRQASS
ncbi:hypothetical protein FOA52_007670 [Chlamydomonas sp. UWO 241]|nr:hypothetical protein FOA52_007670 [Chlamydomonas sp. UWO 241]